MLCECPVSQAAEHLLVIAPASSNWMEPDVGNEDQPGAFASHKADTGVSSASKASVPGFSQKGRCTSAAPTAGVVSDVSTSTEDANSQLSSSYELITEDEVMSSTWPAYRRLSEKTEGNC